MSYPRLLTRPMRTVSRLRLLFLLLRPSSPNPNGFCFAELSTNLLVALSKLCRPIIKKRYSDKCLGRSALFSNEYTITIGNPITRKIPSKSLSMYISIYFLMVDLGGFAPPSRTLFSRLHTAITYSIYLFLIVVNL